MNIFIQKQDVMMTEYTELYISSTPSPPLLPSLGYYRTNRVFCAQLLKGDKK